VRLVGKLLERPTRLLGTILISDSIVSVALSTSVALFGLRLADRSALSEGLALTISSAVLIIALLILGETVPKLLAVRRPLRVALALAPLVAALDYVLAPISRLLEGSTAGLFSRVRPVPFPTEAELKMMIEVGKERGVIKGSEEEILWNLVELNQRRVSEIMTPRIDIAALERTVSMHDAIDYARKMHRSRFPVYDGTIDRITGIFYVKDFFRLDDHSVPVSSVSREAYFIPENKRVPALLDEFRRLGMHVAVVVDEFGQTAGIVTLEDVLEVIFGEIRDEYDSAEQLPYNQIDDETWSVDGDVDLRTLNRLFRHAFRGQDFERLSGFIHHILGRLPEAGDRFEFRDLSFEVQSVTGNAIERVIIRTRHIADGVQRSALGI
jgi:putative hemolysin